MHCLQSIPALTCVSSHFLPPPNNSCICTLHMLVSLRSFYWSLVLGEKDLTNWQAPAAHANLASFQRLERDRVRHHSRRRQLCWWVRGSEGEARGTSGIMVVRKTGRERASSILQWGTCADRVVVPGYNLPPEATSSVGLMNGSAHVEIHGLWAHVFQALTLTRPPFTLFSFYLLGSDHISITCI